MRYAIFWEERKYPGHASYIGSYSSRGAFKDYYEDINEAFKAANDRQNTHPYNEYIVKDYNGR